MPKYSPLITIHRRAGWTIVLMLLAAMGLFVTGIFLPFTSLTKLWLFENQISVFRGLIVLWKQGEPLASMQKCLLMKSL